MSRPLRLGFSGALYYVRSLGNARKVKVIGADLVFLFFDNNTITIKSYTIWLHPILTVEFSQIIQCF
ncbi:hypothetical protein [uncultured Psychromonas sp.]|uniref:hypothetical protein n=1 Tax=uncultured Psychromonas sp. TaxID=173974 RepID=UPI002627781F|nr:hypothetical protein [uncultured Psychromonas sp.]